LKKQSFKYSLLGFIFLMIMFMIFMSGFSMMVIKSIETQYSTLIEKMLSINDIGNDINSSVFYFDKYFTTKSYEDKVSYEKYYDSSLTKLKSLNFNINVDIDVKFQDLNNLLQNYHKYGELAIYKLVITGRTDECYEYFVEAKQIASYSGEYVKRLNDGYLKYNNTVYQSLKDKTRNVKVIIGIFIVFSTLFCLLFSAFFSKWVTTPIAELAASAEEISKGNLNIENMQAAGIYEIDTLQAGFTKMTGELKILIEKMKEKSIIEKKLSEQELKNLLVENILRETQLKVLQSQINPHFLFNTLNTIAQTAMIEDAEETEELINAVSELLRYSLSMIDKQSSVCSEIKIIKQYMYIQETRFRDRIKFNISVDKNLNNIAIPGMILQPLVENAFVHGIENREEGGEINISVYEEDNNCILLVEDNGSGISEDKLEEILNDNEIRTNSRSTGIGVKNVIKRMRYTYPNEDVFNIESTVNKGTRIYLKIPITRGDPNVQSTNC
jgi:sensor histidine kinase YesM